MAAYCLVLVQTAMSRCDLTSCAKSTMWQAVCTSEDSSPSVPSRRWKVMQSSKGTTSRRGVSRSHVIVLRLTGSRISAKMTLLACKQGQRGAAH